MESNVCYRKDFEKSRIEKIYITYINIGLYYLSYFMDYI